MKIKVILSFILISICLSSCTKATNAEIKRISPAPTFNLSADFEYLRNNIPTLEQNINRVINDELWYGFEVIDLDFLLNKTVEYEIYYNEDTHPDGDKFIYINLLFLTPSYKAEKEEDTMYVSKELQIDKYGLQSYFNASEYNSLEYLKNGFEQCKYIGKAQISINKALKPEYSPMNDTKIQEINNIEKWLRDDIKNQFSAGSYEVYIKNFYNNDSQTAVIIKDKQDQYYYADLYNIKDEGIAVTRYEFLGKEKNESEQTYLKRYGEIKTYADKVKTSAARCFNIDI